MKNCILLLLSLLFFAKGDVMYSGDVYNAFNIFNTDQTLYNFTEVYPERTVGLNFTKISTLTDGMGAAINENGDLYYWGSVSAYLQ